MLATSCPLDSLSRRSDVIAKPANNLSSRELAVANAHVVMARPFVQDCTCPCRVGKSLCVELAQPPLGVYSHRGKCPCYIGNLLPIEIAQPPPRQYRQSCEHLVILVVHCRKCPCRVGSLLSIGLAQPLLRCYGQAVYNVSSRGIHGRKCPRRVGNLLPNELAQPLFRCLRQGCE